jgi:hypothetical protein
VGSLDEGLKHQWQNILPLLSPLSIKLLVTSHALWGV